MTDPARSYNVNAAMPPLDYVCLLSEVAELDAQKVWQQLASLPVGSVSTLALGLSLNACNALTMLADELRRLAEREAGR